MNTRSVALAFAALTAFAVSPLRAALPGAESLAKLIISEFDTNSDGSIDSGEWQDGIESSFDDMDANGDGSVELEEANGLTKDIAEDTGEAAATVIVALIKQILSTLDADGNKLISLKEYSSLSSGLFNKLDADKNNSLSLSELTELPVKALTK